MHRCLIAGKPSDDQFRQPPLPARSVHDLDLARTAGDSPNEPIAPCPRFVVVSEIHEGQERERGVAQPAVAIIPVPHPAQALRQRGRGSSDDPACWGVGQSLQCDERPFYRFSPWADVGTPIAPLAPERFRTLQRMERIDHRRRTLKGGPIREDEGNGLTGLDRELTDRFGVVTVKRWGSQDQALRADNRVGRAIIGSADSWHGCPVIETHYQLGMKNHSPGPTYHNPHKIAPSAGGMKSITAAEPVAVWNSVSRTRVPGR
jgi:hypothetical protein